MKHFKSALLTLIVALVALSAPVTARASEPAITGFLGPPDHATIAEDFGHQSSPADDTGRLAPALPNSSINEDSDTQIPDVTITDANIPETTLTNPDDTTSPLDDTISEDENSGDNSNGEDNDDNDSGDDIDVKTDVTDGSTTNQSTDTSTEDTDASTSEGSSVGKSDDQSTTDVTDETDDQSTTLTTENSADAGKALEMTDSSTDGKGATDTTDDSTSSENTTVATDSKSTTDNTPIEFDNTVKFDESGSSTGQPVTLADSAPQSTCPTPKEVYDRIIALKEKYPEGMHWDNYTPYGKNGTLGSAYIWNGGVIDGNINSGTGCAAFVFLLSDEAFGDLPARTYYMFTFDDIKIGDILRVKGNAHAVIILQKGTGGIIVTEANLNGSVHWERAISKEEIESDASVLITRWPTNYVDPTEDPTINEPVQSGTEGNLSWTLSKGGTLTITGTGSMPHYSVNDNKLPSWNTYNDSIMTIVVEDGITNIGNYAFYGNKAIEVFIGNSVSNIGQSAFEKSQIVAVTTPGSCTTIGASAFRDCPNLVSATVNEGLKVIGDNAFRGTTSLRYIDFPSTITSIGSGAFMDAEKLTRIRFAPGTGRVTLGDDVFRRCWALIEVLLPENSDRVSPGMFANCISLPVLYIPAGVSEIGQVGAPSGFPFSQCPNLLIINFGGSESEWIAKGGPTAINAMNNGVVVNFNVPFNNPFAIDPDEPDPFITEEDADTEHTHSFGAWTIDQAATADQDGSQHRDCTICTYRETQSIPATGTSSTDSDNASADNSSGNNPANGDSPTQSNSSTSGDHSTQNPSVGSNDTNSNNSTNSSNSNNNVGTSTASTSTPGASFASVQQPNDNIFAIQTSLPQASQDDSFPIFANTQPTAEISRLDDAKDQDQAKQKNPTQDQTVISRPSAPQSEDHNSVPADSALLGAVDNSTPSPLLFIATSVFILSIIGLGSWWLGWWKLISNGYRHFLAQFFNSNR